MLDAVLLDGASLQATVRGSATYAVRVQTNLRKATWVGSCACPVAFDCKHVVAVLLETRDWLARGEAAEPCTAPRDWERHRFWMSDEMLNTPSMLSR